MMIDVSTGTIFVVSFLGSLFAIIVALALTYTYVTLRLIPKFKRGLQEIAASDPNDTADELLGQLKISLDESAAAFKEPSWERVGAARAEDSKKAAVRVIFSCEDHGHCAGCPKVLAQFDAIIRHQGEASFDDVERKCYATLCERLQSAALLDGETDNERQNERVA